MVDAAGRGAVRRACSRHHLAGRIAVEVGLEAGLRRMAGGVHDPTAEDRSHGAVPLTLPSGAYAAVRSPFGS